MRAIVGATYHAGEVIEITTSKRAARYRALRATKGENFYSRRSSLEKIAKAFRAGAARASPFFLPTTHLYKHFLLHLGGAYNRSSGGETGSGPQSSRVSVVVVIRRRATSKYARQ